MLPLTVVIITKNEAENIVPCVRSARAITDDIIVVDAESDDATATLAANENVKLINLRWNGYGNARNTGAAAATNEWIFSLDADERITPGLASELKKMFPGQPGTIYGFRRRNFFGEKEIKHGSLGYDKIWRLYNRNAAKWDAAPVHEKLHGSSLRSRYLNSYVNHFTIRSFSHYSEKSTRYAYLCALKYLADGKNCNFLKKHFAAKFNFIKSYFLLLGFLDGKEGLCIARVNANYTRLKYQLLAELALAEKRALKKPAAPSRVTNFHSFSK